MKKLLLMMVLIPLFVSGQDSTELTAREMYRDAKAGIDKLVRNLEGPAKQVYNMYVYQQRIEAITYIVSSFFFLIISIGLYKFMSKKADFSLRYIDGYQIATVVSMIVAVLSAICILFADFSQLLNPEYHAIKDIIETFK